MTIEIIPIHMKREIEIGEKLADRLLKTKFQDGDILVVTQKIISKQEGRIVDLSTVIPSILAQGIGSEYNKDPNLLEVILSESKRIVRMENGIIIVETNNGFICANAGVDESNVPNGYATLLPVDPDKSAQNLREEISKKSGKKIAVLISDTFGRPFRLGQADCAIGISGIDSILNYVGKKDTFGKILRVTEMAIADEICSATELVMGKTSGCPAAIIRNYNFTPSNDTAKSLIRSEDEDLFR
jgi:coenzyme F420-0:L-glutamate ligase / coenzyme F420-1:gamma-L-glutamate ligase